MTAAPFVGEARLSLVRQAAAEYIAAGFAVTLVRDKRGTPTGWPIHPAAPEQFLPGDDIGLICGPLSDGGHPGHSLLCLEADTADALTLGLGRLPETGMVDHRPGSGGGHFWYLVTNESVPLEWQSACQTALTLVARGLHPGPSVRYFRPLEVKGTGAQAVVPPSLGKSGQPRQWHGGRRGDPARLAFPDLLPRMMAWAEALGWSPNRAERRRSERAPRPAKADRTATTKPASGTVGQPGRPSLYDDAEVGDRTVRVAGVDYPEAERIGQFERQDDGIPDPDRSTSGRFGHRTFFTYLKRACNCYLIRSHPYLRELAGKYNAKLPADDRWSAAEIEHKLGDALNPSDQSRYPAGRLLRPPAPPMAWDDPARLAGEFLADVPAVFLDALPLVYDGRCYRAESKDGFAARVRGFAERAAAAEFARRTATHAAALTALDRREREAEKLPTEHREAVAADVKRERAKLERDRAKVAPKVTGELVAGAVQSARHRGRLAPHQRPDGWLERSDRPAPLLPVANGLLDVGTDTLHPHDRAYFATSALPVAFDPAAGPPVRWLAYLSDVMEGDAARVNVLQELFGFCLDPGYPVKAFGLLVGPGQNGKSAFTAGLAAVLGDENISAVPLDALTGDRGGFAAFDLVGKRANVVSDMQYIEMADEGMLRTLTGGDIFRAEPKGMKGVHVRNTAKLLFGTNTPPRFGDKTDATWNRMVCVPFDWTVPADCKDERMKSPGFWTAEAAGMLTWGLAGIKRLKANGWFTRAVKCEALKTRLIGASNPVRLFLEDHYRPEAGAFTPTAELVEGYGRWSAANGIARKATSDTFADLIATAHPPPAVVLDRGYTPDRKRVRGFRGLARVPDG